MISGFLYFLAPFIHIINGIAINSFIFNNTGVVFVKIVKPWEFIIKVLVMGLIIILSSFVYSNPIIIRFNKMSII